MFRRPPTGPSEFPARLTWWLGIAAFLPPLAPAAALLAAANGLLGHLLCSKHPERYTGKKWIWAGLGLSILAMALFFVEAGLFLHWKRHQVASGRVAVSRFRLQQVAEALERYREEKGRYPEVSGIHLLKETLEPRFTSDCPVLDGFGGALSVWSRADGFRVETSPLPLPGGGTAPPLFAEGHFQPSPSPPPPPAPEGDAGASSSGGTPPAPNPAEGSGPAVGNGAESP